MPECDFSEAAVIQVPHRTMLVFHRLAPKVSRRNHDWFTKLSNHLPRGRCERAMGVMGPWEWLARGWEDLLKRRKAFPATPEPTRPPFELTFGQLSQTLGQLPETFSQLPAGLERLSRPFGQPGEIQGRLSKKLGQLSPAFGQLSRTFGRLSPDFGHDSEGSAPPRGLWGRLCEVLGQLGGT